MASRRLLLRAALAAVLVAVLAVAVVQSHRHRTARAQALHYQRELYQEQGRQFLLTGDWQRALPFLGAAMEGAEDDVALSFLAGRTTAALRGEGLALVESEGKVHSFRAAEFRRIELTTADVEPERLVRADLDAQWTRLVAVTAEGRGLLFDPFGDRPAEELAPTGLVDLRIRGERIAGLSKDGRLSLWHAESGALLSTVTVVDTGAALAFSPDGRFLATLDANGAAKIWEARDDSLVRRGGGVDSIDPSGRITALDSDGRHLVVAGEQATEIWNGRNGKALVSLALPFGAEVRAIEIGSKGRLVTVGQPPEVRLWNGANGELTALLEGHTASVCCAEFSASGDLLLTAGADATARIWDPRRARLLANVPLGDGEVIHAAYGPREERIATVHTDGSLRVVSLPPYRDGALELERLRHCFVPWRLAEDRLLPAVPDARACRHITPSAGGARGHQPELPILDEPLAEPAAPAQEPIPVTSPVDPERASLGEPIDLRLHDADLVETLRTFARIADLNLLVAPGVEGKIHAEFNQLPWDLALDAILRTEDLAVAHWEGLVFVFPARRAPPAFQALPPPWGDGKPLPSARQLPVVELLEELVAPGVKKQDSPQDIATPERWGEPVDLSLKGVDLYKTLRLFSRIGDFELLLDGDVTGSLSCELRGVPWDKAFVAILALHDLPFEEARNPLTGRQILRIRRRTPEAPP